MLVSVARQFAFVHIPKTGGSTITEVLAPYITKKRQVDKPALSGPGWQEAWHLLGGQHASLKDSLEDAERQHIDLDSFYIFTFVRNPYSWILSIWNNFYTPNEDTKASLAQQLRRGAGRLRRKVVGAPLPREIFWQTYPDASFHSFLIWLVRQRSSWTTEKAFFGIADQYSYIKNEKRSVDFIGKFERLEDDLRRLSAKLKIAPPEVVPRRLDRSDSRAEKWLNFYKDDGIHVVNELFERDFVEFGYERVEHIPIAWNRCS